MKNTIIIMLIFISELAAGQSFDSFMLSVEQNNPQLITLQKWLEAEETKAKTGIYPANPEMNYSHLWGNPFAEGNQQELEITQSFKLPGYYTSKSAVQQLNFEQQQALAEKEKREILHIARLAWFNLVWLHKKEDLLKTRNADAQNLVGIMQEGLEGGEISKPLFDKARIYAIDAHTEWQKLQSEIEVQQQYLLQLNGGHPFQAEASEYPLDWKLPVLDSLLAGLAENNPELLAVQLGIEQAEKFEKYQRMNSLPSFEAGYKSETILDQKLQGFHAGISIPLWQNANTVKHAKLQTEWSKAKFWQEEGEIKLRLTNLFNEVVAVKTNFEQVRAVLEEEQVSAGNLELLKSGHISFTDYLVDADLIWQAKSKFLRNENAYYALLSQLKVFE
jgi:outer membrane protein, heavy metal efflux system